MRTLQALLDLLGETKDDLIGGVIEMVRTNYRRLHDGSEITGDRLAERAQKSIAALVLLSCYAVIRHIAQAVGLPRGLNATYRDVLREAEDNDAYHLIDASIKLDHTDGFPRRDVERIAGQVERNFIAMSILKQMVVNHFYLFHVDGRVVQEICAKLGVTVRPERRLNPSQKRFPKQRELPKTGRRGDGT